MRKIGIIGCGSMGSMLVGRFLEDGVIEADQLMISTRKPGNDRCLNHLEEEYGRLEIVCDNSFLAGTCRTIFLCVRPNQVKGVLEEIAGHLPGEAHLVSAAASVTIDHLQQYFAGKISRIVPSITLKVGNGVTLVCHNRRVGARDAANLVNLFDTSAKVKTIDEQDIEVATNLTSTAPGLIAAMFREFVTAGQRYSTFNRQEVEEMVIETFFGISMLFYQRLMKFPDTVSRVATRGGITEAGDRVIRERLPPFFDELFARTLQKFEEIKTDISNQFSHKN